LYVNCANERSGVVLDSSALVPFDVRPSRAILLDDTAV
jgi:hypothetical protein